MCNGRQHILHGHRRRNQLLETEPPQAGAGEECRIGDTVFELAQPRLNVTAKFHDFEIGPKATRAWEAGSESAATLRRVASWIGRLNLLLGLVVVALAVALVRGGVF